MRTFNVEIFKPDLSFRSSHPVNNPEYKFDYLSLEPNTVNIPKQINDDGEIVSIDVQEGDYIRMQSDTEEICGMVTGSSDNDKYIEISYKHMLKLTDVNVHYDASQLSAKTLEEWLKDIITETYIENTDTMQNIQGMSVVTTSETEDVLLDLDENIGNLNEILQKALITYNVAVQISLNAADKEIVLKIGLADPEVKTIEADLPNIKNASFAINESEESTNKLTVYNQNNETQHLTYYLDTDGNVTTTPDDEKRIAPVVFDTVYISYTESSSSTTFFADKAYEKALNTLKPQSYDNLIKLEMMSDDSLIKPAEMQVGQVAKIIHEGKEYTSILTGKNESSKTVLIFGAIRNRLTDILRRKL